MIDRHSIIEAFCKAEPRVTCCTRGSSDPTYVHVHGPSQPAREAHCRSHCLIVEANGTVAFRELLGRRLGARLRPLVPISQDPLGYSNGPDFGEFTYALDAATIRERFGSSASFAEAVIKECRALGIW